MVGLNPPGFTLATDNKVMQFLRARASPTKKGGWRQTVVV
jgi:hypothetical protein